MSEPVSHQQQLSRYLQSGRFVKRRDFRSDPTYRWKPVPRWRKSKARRELDCYEALREMGVPCPPGVEIREERNWLGMLVWSEISMPFIDDTADLRYICLLPEFESLRQDPRWRRGLVREVARLIRLMHAHDYFSQNLHFRNLLVGLKSDPDKPLVYLIDCVSGKRARRGPMRSHLHLKDLGFLYRDARYHCTVRERLRFMHLYLGRSKLTAADREFVERMIAYVRKKWGSKSSTLG